MFIKWYRSVPPSSEIHSIVIIIIIITCVSENIILISFQGKILDNRKEGITNEDRHKSPNTIDQEIDQESLNTICSARSCWDMFD